MVLHGEKLSKINDAQTWEAKLFSRIKPDELSKKA
jgi:hypothetical protein